MRRMPIGIQTFEDIITGGYAYVDKTEWVCRLAKEGKYFFLGRPRRFGKSLLLSTLRSYFEGRRELFAGLAAERLEAEWTPYPVLHIDLNVAAYKDVGDLEAGLDTNLRHFEKIWNPDGRTADRTPSARFYDLIRTACEKSGRGVVVLVDEYDRPLLQTMEQDETNDGVRNALKGFYGVLKSADPWLRFTLLTGVTKFSKVSVFSDLNMLRDISLSAAYAGICGISARELEGSLGPELAALAEKNGMRYGEAVAEMKKRYDGYHFCEDGEGMFNPFSVLNALADRKFAYYWFKTGTPTFLIEQMKRASFDPLRFTEGVTIPARSIDDYRADGGNPVPLLYQSGYLTIAGYDRELDEYILDFPNEEVLYGFFEELLPAYTYGPPDGQGFFVGDFFKDLRAGDTDGFMTRMRAFFANIPYDLNDKTERHYQLVFYLVFTLLGQYTRAEVRGAKGRADAVVETADAVYVFEFKLNGTAEEALRQIDDKACAIPYIRSEQVGAGTAGRRRIVKIGAAFDKDERNIARWLVAEA
ncbi:MAG: ATP-binding protein [Clostridiales Family XIII bacterium]|nr:ATP-binding protein [Clostridiales Family XIII bacterium]